MKAVLAVCLGVAMVGCARRHAGRDPMALVQGLPRHVAEHQVWEGDRWRLVSRCEAGLLLPELGLRFRAAQVVEGHGITWLLGLPAHPAEDHFRRPVTVLLNRRHQLFRRLGLGPWERVPLEVTPGEPPSPWSVSLLPLGAEAVLVVEEGSGLRGSRVRRLGGTGGLGPVLDFRLSMPEGLFLDRLGARRAWALVGDRLVVDGGDGRLQVLDREARLERSMAHPAPGLHVWMQPWKDGRVLVGVGEDIMTRVGHREGRRTAGEAERTTFVNVLCAEHLQQVTRAPWLPERRWWLLDPVTGGLEALPPPKGGLRLRTSMLFRLDGERSVEPLEED